VASSHRTVPERKGRWEERHRRSHKEEPGPRGHYPSSSETKAMPELLFSTTGLHYTASRLHGINSPCTGILSPSPPIVSSPPHLARHWLCLTWNHLACHYRGSSGQNPRPSPFDHMLTHTWCTHSLAWPSHRGSKLATARRCTARSRHGQIKPWRGLALDMLGNRGREKRHTRSRTRSHSRTRTKHRGTERQEHGNTPPRARPERACHG
jgi:hypothetical protein